MDLDQATGITLAEAHGGRAQHVEHHAAITDFHAADRAFFRDVEFVTIPEPDGNAWIPHLFHEPANDGAVEVALSQALADIGTHACYLSAEASAKV